MFKMGWLIELYTFVLNDKYWHALAIIIFAIILAELLMLFFKHVVEKIAKRTRTKADNKIIMRIETPIIVLILLLGVQLALRRIITSVNFFEDFISTVIIFIVTYIFSKTISIVLDYWRHAKRNGKSDERFHEEMLPLMKSIANILLVSIAMVVVLQMWGVQVGALLASVGIIGIILGFAFQDTMKNIFGGLALISDGSIHQHDVIKLESGEVGEVVEMTLRSTKIKTYDNDYLLVPNGVLANSRFVNYAQPTHSVRVVIPIAVAYGSDVAKVKDVLLGVLKNRTDVLKYPKRDVRFMKMGDFSLDFDFLFYINDFRNRYTMIDQITTASYNALRENGIQIPFPTRTLYHATQPISSLTALPTATSTAKKNSSRATTVKKKTSVSSSKRKSAKKGLVKKNS